MIIIQKKSITKTFNIKWITSRKTLTTFLALHLKKSMQIWRKRILSKCKYKRISWMIHRFQLGCKLEQIMCPQRILVYQRLVWIIMTDHLQMKSWRQIITHRKLGRAQHIIICLEAAVLKNWTFIKECNCNPTIHKPVWIVKIIKYL
jgi:hypothetical protein